VYCKEDKVFVVKEIKGTPKEVWHKAKDQMGMSLVHFCNLTYHKKEIKVYEVKEIKCKKIEYEPTLNFNGYFMYI